METIITARQLAVKAFFLAAIVTLKTNKNYALLMKNTKI